MYPKEEYSFPSTKNWLTVQPGTQQAWDQLENRQEEMASIPLVNMKETVECRYMSPMYFFLTVSMNPKASICEMDLTKEKSVSALVLELIGMSFIH